MTGAEFLSKVTTLINQTPDLAFIETPRLEVNKEDLGAIYFYMAVEKQSNGKRKTAYTKYSDSISPGFVVQEILRALEI